MQYEVGQIVYHANRGKCVVVEAFDSKNPCAGPRVCDIHYDTNGASENPFFTRVFPTFSMYLSTEPPKPQPTKPQPLVIKGQGSFTVTIEEGEV